MSNSLEGKERNPLLIPVTKEDKDDWQGFCELDSEPAYFNILLRDWGVKGVKVQEVYSLDPDILLSLAKPTYGLVFLFQYKADELNMQEASCPPHVWFANQTNDSACATVSLLNIVLNLQDFEDVEIGPNLEAFKDFTQGFTPALRGDEIGNFEFVKRLHNSFARKMDIFNTDLGLKNKYDDRNKPEAKPKPKLKSKAKAKSKVTTKKSKATRKTAIVSESDYEDPADDADENEDENAYHFQAYVPIGSDVWMLDGLNRQPVKIGPVPDHSSHPLGWLSLIAGVLQERMEMYQANDIHVSLMSLGKDPLIDHRKDLASNVKAIVEVEKQLDKAEPSWRGSNENAGPNTLSNVEHLNLEASSKLVPNGNIAYSKGHIDVDDSASNGTLLPSNEGLVIPGHLSGLGITTSLLASTDLPGSVRSTLTSPQTAAEDLKSTHARLLDAQRDFVRLIEAELKDWHNDDISSLDRRSDYGAVVGKWLTMLCSKEGDDGKQGTIVRNMVEALR